MSHFRSCAGRLVSYDVNGLQYRRLDANGTILLGDGIELVYVSVQGGGQEPLKLSQGEFEEAYNFKLTPKTYWDRRGTYPVFRNKKGRWCSGAMGTRLHLSNRVKTAGYARRMALEFNKLVCTQVGTDTDLERLKEYADADSREQLKKIGVKK